MSVPERHYVDAISGEMYDSAEAALEAQRAHQMREVKKRSEHNPRFVQLTKEVAPMKIAQIAKESAKAVEVLMLFFDVMNNRNVVVASQETIADHCGGSTRTIMRAIKVLEKHDAIGIGKVGNMNVYIINPNIAWQQARSKRKDVILEGNILLGKAENEALFDRFNSVFAEAQNNKPKLSATNARIIQSNKSVEKKINRPKQDEVEVLPEKLPPGDYKDWANDEPLGEHAERLKHETEEEGTETPLDAYEDYYDEADEEDYLPPGERPPSDY